MTGEQTPTPDADRVNVAFVCVQNAGRSQMAYAFARREMEERGLEGDIGLLTGGTQPAAHVHDVVVDAMREQGIDLSDRTPRAVTVGELQAADIVITMGCSAGDICPSAWTGETRDWELDDPHGRPPGEVRDIRDEIRHRVASLFDELLDDGAHSA
ncbi:MAG: low molecular weight phosphatase family protein [Halobacteriaceae archaeon]